MGTSRVDAGQVSQVPAVVRAPVAAVPAPRLEVQGLLADVHRLPASRPALLRVVQLADSPDCSGPALADAAAADPAFTARLRALVEDPHLQSLLHALLLDVTASVRTSLDDLDGGLQVRLTGLVQEGARRVLADPSLQRRIDERLSAAVRYAVEHYGDAVVVLISRVVRGWDARDASARIEAAVGRDLQYIRINGTVVGALAGVALHAVEVLVA